MLVAVVPVPPVGVLLAFTPGSPVSPWAAALLVGVPVVAAALLGPIAWPGARRWIAAARMAVAEAAMWALPALLGAPLFFAACGSADLRWGAVPAAVAYVAAATWGIRRAPRVWWAWPVAIAVGIAAAIAGFHAGPQHSCVT